MQEKASIFFFFKKGINLSVSVVMYADEIFIYC